MSRAPLLLAVPALAGCFLLPSGDPSQVKEVPPELRKPRLVAPPVADRHEYGDVTKVQVGQWARYRERDREVTLAAVAREGEAVWIEVIEEGEPRLASARLVAPDGAVKKAFYGEIAKDGKSAVVVQPLSQWNPPPAVVFGSLRKDAVKETVKVGEREIRAYGARTRSENLEGRLTEETVLWSAEVPPLWGEGLVRRRSPAGAVDLLDYGTRAKPLVEIPK